MDHNKHIDENMKRLRQTMKEALEAYADIGTPSTWKSLPDYEPRWRAAKLSKFSRRMVIEAQHLEWLITRMQSGIELARLFPESENCRMQSEIDEGADDAVNEGAEFDQNVDRMIRNAATPINVKF